MPSKLTVKDLNSGDLYEYAVVSDETRIGRAADRNDIVLNDSQVSRQHAVLRRVENSYVIIDLDSANGTFINGERIKQSALKSGDVVMISRFSLSFEETTRLAVKYDEDKQVSGTILMRAPLEIATIIPEVEKSLVESAELGSKALLEDIQALRKKAETLARLYELNQVLGSVFELSAIFKKVSEMMFRLTPADRFMVLLKDPATNRLAPHAAEYRDSAGQVQGEEISISKTVLDQVQAERVSLLSYNTGSDERLSAAKSIIMQNIRSVMCAPLLSKNNLLGVLYVDSHDLTRMFSEDDLDLLNALAAETSIAVDNAITHEQLVREELARAKYRRFMPPHVVDEILANPDALNLGGTNTSVTMLFSDVRDFTSMSEGLPPQTVVQILNVYFASMTPIVFEHQGLLDKYMGDGLMALFGVPYQGETAAANAIRAAIAMQRRMKTLNQDLKAGGLSEISIGIGINTGMVTVGYIGSEQRTDYTAIGDAVNLAARLEKEAKAWQIIISQSTLDAIGEQFPVRPVGKVKVKGKKEPVQVYEVLWEETGIDLSAAPPPHIQSHRITRFD